MTEKTQEDRITHLDLLISGGTVFDGTGAEGVRADVGIAGERIVAVGGLSRWPASVTLNVAGKSVAPGFIDIHTHSDISVTYDTRQASYLTQGVTTQVVGNCGLSLGLVQNNDTFEFERRWFAPYGAEIRWNTFAEFLSVVENEGTGTNFYSLAGHGSLRKREMGMADRPPAKDEMAAMKRELALALEAGAWGFSTGLEYPPSSFAEENELAELSTVLRDYGGFYATHLRNEGDTLIESVQEALNIVERAGVSLQLSHHKAEDARNWNKTLQTLALMDAARARGVEVYLDQYPYTAFMTSLAIQTLPKWALSGSNDDTLDRLKNPQTRAEIRADRLLARPDWNDTDPQTSPWRLLQMGSCRARPDIQGFTILELARQKGMAPLDYVLELLADTPGFVAAVNFAIGDEDIERVMRSPFTSIGSDGVGTHPGGKNGEEQIHPRAYGTFPRVLGTYVRERGVLTEAEAVHKMTGLTAGRLGLAERGRIAPGFFADLTIYDPRTVTDLATFETPHRFSRGIETVILNGRIVVSEGVPNGLLAGEVLRRF